MALESAGESTSKKKARKLSYNEKRELESMESRIQEREAALVQLQQEAQKPENLANAPLLADLYQQIGETQESIDRLYERWAELEAEG